MSAKLKKYVQLNYTIEMYRDEDNDWIASIKELKGCIAHGPTLLKALANLEGMKKLWLESAIKNKRPIPLSIDHTL